MITLKGSSHVSNKPVVSRLYNRRSQSSSGNLLGTLGRQSQPSIAPLQRIFAPFRPQHTKVKHPQAIPKIPPTKSVVIEECLDKARAASAQWGLVTIQERAQMIRKCMDYQYADREEWAQVPTKVRGTYGQGAAEGQIAAAVVMNTFRQYWLTLKDDLQVECDKRVNDQGKWEIDVFPKGIDGLLFGGCTMQIVVEKGQKPTNGSCYKDGVSIVEPGVSGILGAGNEISVVVYDILHTLLVQNNTCVVKMNPVNDYMGPLLANAFKDFVDQGYITFVYGGVEEGAALVNSPKVDEVFITGSEATYNAITQPGTNLTVSNKPVFAELGCVSPYIIVPGQWSQEEIEYVCHQLLIGLSVVSGHACLALELIVMPKNWTQRDQFMSTLKQFLDQVPKRQAYYPNSQAKFDAFKKAFPKAVGYGCDGVDGSGGQPWLMAEGLEVDEAQTRQENWCGVVQEVLVDGDENNVDQYLENVVDFANNSCWGTLSCAMFVSDQSMQEHQTALNASVDALQYGTVSINAAPHIAYGQPQGVWGGSPLYSGDDIQSGNVLGHNCLFIDHPEKCVYKHMWCQKPDPPLLSPMNRNLDAISAALFAFQYKRGFFNFITLFIEFLKS